MFTTLHGHTTPETAYVVDDYPYGFRLRCKIRYWLETRKNHGTRFCSQTTNPKKSGEVWNKPKASTYFTGGILIMRRDDNPGETFGHVVQDALRITDSPASYNRFRRENQLSEQQLAYLDVMEATSRKHHQTTWAAYENGLFFDSFRTLLLSES